MKFNVLGFFVLTLMGFACIYFFSCKSPATPNEDAAAKWVKHPRIYWTERPSEHAVISWTSGFLSSHNKVYYDTLSHAHETASRYAFSSSRVVSGPITMNLSDLIAEVPQACFNHAEIDSLRPNTRYYYRFCTGQVCSEEYYFITAPKKNLNIQFLFGGDSRVGKSGEEDDDPQSHQSRRNMNQLVAKLIEADTQIMALVHGADYGMKATWKYLYYWFQDHELTITSDNRVLPLIISRGNHDHQVGFTENFRLGYITENASDGYYYSTQLTDSIALITLNTETAMGGYQKNWLEKELKRLRKNQKWLMVQYHKPAFPAVKPYEREDFARVRKAWVPLFEKYQIDLAMESDGHALKRTAPILNESIHPEGIVYIGEGGMGVPQRKTDPTRWYFQDGGHASSNHHVWKISIQQDSLFAQAIGMQNEIILSFSLPARKFK